jgi:large subunit ribosomal protein L25
MPLTVDSKALRDVLRRHHGGNVLFDLKVDGQAPEGLAAMIRALQIDPATDELLSVDFQWVSLTEEVHLQVPVRPEGVAAGVKAGGMLEVVLHEVTVACLPTNIPEEFIVDVTAMEQGQSLHVADLVPPEGVRILTHAEEPVVSVRAPHVVIEVAPAAEEGAEEAAEEGEGEAEE